jgi:geranyl-CoA carboxylase alpha subunit
MASINKILVANRGEIAVRVIHTARQLGYRTVAVYSEADSDSLHVDEADEAVCIGPASVGESYLLVEKIIAAAKLTAADAIHPGYGFLSENCAFSQACADENITFIGPPAAAIKLMGSKRLSKIAMLEAGVPCITGYQGEQQDNDFLINEAKKIGFPLMVKASAGGGGRGMRLVFEASELARQIKTARSEAKNAFGSDELILERAVIEPRHIEIQVFADNFGSVVHLGERDCSIQRRHQKVVEEAPSPFMDENLRERMGKAAVDAARSCNYRGAGTIEFLVDSDKNFYFLEMNTRLQVEHPVTELVTGLDLVEWQLRVASGEPLPLQQEQINLQGHAVEVRLYAEDPRNDFMPQTGKVINWSTPQREGIRVDGGIKIGQVISPHYDPMLAKVIAFGENRELAVRRLASAIQDTQLLGVNHNKNFLQHVLRHRVFVEGEATTAFIGQHFSNHTTTTQAKPPTDTLARAAVLYYRLSEQNTVNCYQHASPWRNALGRSYSAKLEYDGKEYAIDLNEIEGDFKITVDDETIELRMLAVSEFECVFVENGIRKVHYFAFDQEKLYLDDGNGHFIFDNLAHRPAAAVSGAGSGQVKATMDGAIVDVLVSEGDTVAQGQTIVVLEAMKMEHQLKAGIAGVVAAINVQAGLQVKSKQILATIDEPGSE